MTSRERLGMAQGSRNLGEVELDAIGDIDIVRACGMAAQQHPLGLAVWRWRVAGDRREAITVARGLVDLGYEEQLVGETMRHLLNDSCGHCLGRGYALIPGTPMLSDAVCPHCDGTGRTQPENDDARHLVEVVARIERLMADAVMCRLRDEMEV